MDEKELRNVFKQNIEGAKSEEKQKRYLTAVELYYKALVNLCDILILRERGDIPDYHKLRGEILEELNHDINKIRKEFHIRYREAYYKLDFTIEDTKRIRNAIKTIIQIKALNNGIKEAVKEL
jgi:hypothetical protein